MNYLASPPLCVAYALAGTMDIDIVGRPAGPGRARPGRLPARHLALRARGRRDDRAGGPARTCSGAATARCSPATSAGTACRCPTGERFAWDADSTYVRLPPYFEGMPPEPEPRARHRRRARAGAARRQRHDRPHLPGRLDQARRARGRLPAGAGRRAARLQLLRLAPRQPRGDDARHVRQHPPAQPARRRRAAARRRRHALSPGIRRPTGEQMSIYDAAMRYMRRAASPLVVLARQGVRLGLLARLGREGHAACSACGR